MSQSDRIRGCLYGQAIGDALGLKAEFKSSTLLQMMYDPPGPTEYESLNRGASVWKKGEWTDDTEMALCIFDAYLADGDLIPSTVAKNFLRWAHEDGRGMGNHTWNVLSDSLFLLDPEVVARSAWEGSGKQMAPNGGVMRTSVVGILRPDDLAWTEANAEKMCRTTHYDPRCVAGSVAISLTIRALVNGASVAEAIEHGVGRASAYHPDVEEWANKSLEELNLDEGLDEPNRRRPPIGYTWKCMGAGFWALRNMDTIYGDIRGATTPEKFLRTLQEVIMAGGDTDTNGAVAGAMMGAYVGQYLIPGSLKSGLYDQAGIDRRLDQLLSVHA